MYLNFKGCVFYYLILILTKLTFQCFFTSWSSANVYKIHIKTIKKKLNKSSILVFDCLKKSYTCPLSHFEGVTEKKNIDLTYINVGH